MSIDTFEVQNFQEIAKMTDDAFAFVMKDFLSQMQIGKVAPSIYAICRFLKITSGCMPHLMPLLSKKKRKMLVYATDRILEYHEKNRLLKGGLLKLFEQSLQNQIENADQIATDMCFDSSSRRYYDDEEVFCF